MRLNRRSFTAGLLASGLAIPALAQTPSSGETQRYLSHGGRITSEIPADWQPYPTVADLMLSPDGGFIFAYATIGESLEAVSERSLSEMKATSVEPIEIDGVEGSVITGGTSQMIGIPAVRLVLPYDEPFTRWGSRMTHVAIDISPEAAEAIIPTVSRDMSAVSPQEYVHSIIDVAQLNAIVTEDMPWDDLRAQADERVTDMESAHEWLTGEFRDAFKEVGDAHTHFTSPDVMPDTADASPEAVELPTAEELDSGVLHITLPAVDAGAQTDYILPVREALAAHEGCGVIVDLRQNFGGSVFPMVTSLTPLLPAGNAFGFQYPGDVPVYFMSRDEVIISSGAGPDMPANDLDLTAQPVAVLFGPGTASSGELTAISFVGRDKARSFGMESAGYTTSNSSYFLLDGWEMNLATSLMTDRDGTAYGGKLAPDELVEFTKEQIGTGDDPVIAAAQDWLVEQTCDAPAGTPTVVGTPQG